MRFRSLHIAGVVFCAVFFFSTAAAQNAALKLQLAQQFEENEEWEKAQPLYEELFGAESNNYIYFNGLQRCYSQTKDYAHAIALTRRWIALHPDDVTQRSQLAGLYYDSGKEQTADSLWQAILSADQNNIGLYRLVANEMMEHRLYESSIRVYRDAKVKSGNPALFADELGTMYASLQRFTDATTEYTALLKATPDNLSFVQARLGTFVVRPEGLLAAHDVVSAAVHAAPENVVLHRLLAWIQMEQHRPDDAYAEYKIIDKLANSNGQEIFNFAQRLLQEHASKTAARAFREFTLSFPKSPFLPQAQFGFARAIEECRDNDTIPVPGGERIPDASDVNEDHPSYAGAIALYRRICSSNPSPDLAAKSLYRIGCIQFEKYFDLDAALATFQSIGQISREVLLQIGKIEIARNDLEQARKYFLKLGWFSDVSAQEQAAYFLARIDYYECHFDSALGHLQRFTTSLNSDHANNALQLQYFILENKTSAPQALEEFVRADLLIEQHKYGEALAQFRSISSRYAQTLLLDDALMKSAELCLVLHRYEEALSTFRFVADSLPTSIMNDRAQFRIGETYQTLHNASAASEAYQKLLAQFPNSLYAEEARKRIRLLRGQNY
jgi:tetratricopeptide (TPR) repeat protein